MTNNPTSVVREAGLLERWHISRQNVGLLGAVVVSGRYTHANGSTPDKALLYPALEKVIHKYGCLSVCVVGEATSAPAFARLDTVNLDELVVFVDGDLREVLEAETASVFDTSRPLWRVLVLQDGNVLFSFHHVIGDGQSGLAFHQTLLEALSDVNQAPSPHSGLVATVPEATLLPPIEQVADLTVSPFTILRLILRMLVPASWTSAYWAWTGYPSAPEAKLTNRLRLMYFKPEAAHRILQVCRAHNTSLTPLIHTLATLIISEYLAEDPSNAARYSYITTSIPISIRPLVKAPRDAMCNYVSTLNSHPRLIKRAPSTDKAWLRDFPWDTASELTKTLRKQQKDSAEIVGILKLLSNYEGYHKGKLGKKREATFEISNVGKFSADVSKAGADKGSPHWLLDDVYFAQSNPTTGGAIHMNVAGDPAGGIGMSVAWSEGAIDDSFGDAFFAALQEGLGEVVHHDIA